MTGEREIAEKARAVQDQWYRQKRESLRSVAAEIMKKKSEPEKERK